MRGPRADTAGTSRTAWAHCVLNVAACDHGAGEQPHVKCMSGPTLVPRKKNICVGLCELAVKS